MFNLSIEEFYRRLNELDEEERFRLINGIDLVAAEILHKILPDELIIQELLELKRNIK